MPLHVGGRRLDAASDDVDSALENLSFSYLDGVPFELDPKLSSALSTVETHLARAKELLERQPLDVSSLEREFDISHVGKLEKQVLEQLQRLDQEREERRKKEEDMLEAFRKEQEAKKLEEELTKEEAEKAEQEALDSEQGDKREATDEKESTETQSSSTEDLSATSTQPARSPSQETPNDQVTRPLAGLTMASTTHQGRPAPPPVPPFLPPRIQAGSLNFSEFERETDPFERAELDTINDMQELAAVLQKTQTKECNVNPSVTAVAAATDQRLPYRQEQFNPRLPVYPLEAAGSHMRPPYNIPPAYCFQYDQMPQGGGVAYPSQEPSSQPETGLKSSKSVGDLMSEIQRETEGQNVQSANAVGEPSSGSQVKRLSSRTPPPLPRPGARKVEGWVPWPDLDRLPSVKTKEEKPRVAGVERAADLFANLSPDSVNRCRRVHDMGFPLDRVTKVCKSLGDDDQQMINFCLLVDKLIEEGKYGQAGVVEHALLLYSVDESLARKHLEVFRKLAEFGFDKQKIHDALASCGQDYNKALEKLLGSS